MAFSMFTMFYNHLPCLVSIDMENLHALACMQACMRANRRTVCSSSLDKGSAQVHALCVRVFRGGGQVLYT